jgi:hypothetical protein
MPVFFIHAGIMAKNGPALKVKTVAGAPEPCKFSQRTRRDSEPSNEKATALARSGL